jgi:hypothetical protein
MTQNVGPLDRLLRFTGAVLLGIFLVTGQLGGMLALAAGAAALVLLGTSAMGTCPAYRAFGLSTCRPKARV